VNPIRNIYRLWSKPIVQSGMDWPANLLRRARHVLPESSIVVLLPSVALKLFVPGAGRLRQMERKGNLAARRDPLWSERVLEAKAVPFGLVSSRGTRGNEDTCHSATEWARRTLAELMLSAPKATGYDILEPAMAHLFELGLTSDERESIVTSLKSDTVPLSSSHGDFHRGNVICFEDGWRLIDWTLYRHRSTLALDRLHFLMREACTAGAMSWTTCVFSDVPGWADAGAQLEVKTAFLRSLYTVDRVDREIAQLRAIAGAPRKDNKYRQVLKNLARSLTEVPAVSG
jgi:hypothetical protein